MSTITSQNIMTADDGILLPNAATLSNTFAVDNGETLPNSTISSGEGGLVSSGASVFDMSLDGEVQNGGVQNGGVIEVGSGTVLSGGMLIGGAQQYVWGGTVIDVDIQPAQLSDSVIDTSTSGLIVENWYPTTKQVIASGGVVSNFSMAGYTSVYHGMTPGGLVGMHGSYYDYYLTEQIVFNGGIVSGGIIYGGTEYVEHGGIVNNVTLDTYYDDFSGDFGSNIYSALQYVSSGGLANSTIIISGVQYVSSGGIASNTIISSAGGVQIVNGATYDTIVIGGIVSIGETGIASNITVSSGGSVGIQGEAQGNIYISSGGSLGLNPSAVLDGNVTLYPGGHMGIELSNGGSVDLIGNNNSGLVISGYTSGVNNSVTTAISGFSGLGANLSDKVTIDGLQEANVSKVIYPDDNHITLELLDGTSLTLNMIGIKQAGYTLGSDANGDLTMVVCFLSGTMIGMAKGVCAVEDLQVGDAILTYDPKTKAKVKKKITWVGKQKVDVNGKLPDDMAGYPVRILKDAFKKNVPNKDLLITSEHCLFIDGYFVPARMLVNGRSIFYDYSITSYDFYHIETEDHSVIWADGMLTESYLNTGNRHTFNKDQKVVKLDPYVKIWEEDAAAPLTVDRSFVEPIFDKLVKRADKQKLLNQNNKNITLSNDHGLYLLTEEGEEVYQSRIENDKMIFTLPANTQNIYLVSRKSRPCDIIGPFVDDRRYLGVLVGKVSVLNEYGAYPVTKYLQQDELQGWSVVEQSSYRWTMGCAFLPLDVYNAEYPFEISIQIVNAGPYIIEAKYIEEEKIAV